MAESKQKRMSDSPSPPNSSPSLAETKRIKRPPSFYADQAAQNSIQSAITVYDRTIYDTATTAMAGVVQSVPDVEYALHNLRAQRLKERENSLYIPPQAKRTIQSSDDTLFPLMEEALEFLAGSGQVLLLLGDSGGGKSTFNLELEHTLWQIYKKGGPIPLYINLPSIDNPQQNMLDKRLHQLNFSDSQIQELKQQRQFIVICDGYDESQLKGNIYASNLLNQPEQWNSKMVISCRSQYLGSDYRARFQPTNDRYQQPTTNLFQEAFIAPFSRSQVEQYVEQFVNKTKSHATDATLPSWTVKDYMNKLVNIPRLIELVSNPFLLTLAMAALPKIVHSGQGLSTIRLTRVSMYDNFIEQWVETNKLRLQTVTLSAEAQYTFEALLDEGFVQQGIQYQKDLAAAIFQHQGGNPVVEYSRIRENKSWKTSFFGSDALPTLLRESSPLSRSGNQYRFFHRSILEYLYSRVMSDPLESSRTSALTVSGANEPVESFVSHPLNQGSIVGEPSIMQFLAERVELDPPFKTRLLAAVDESKTDSGVSQAAANAISILVKAGIQFNGARLSGIRIPGADIRGGHFDSADLQGADLIDVNLTKTWLRQANLNEAYMAGVQFGELPYLDVGEGGLQCVFSSDDGLLAVSTKEDEVIVFNTATWTKVSKYPGGPAIAFSPTNRELARGDNHTVEVSEIFTQEPRLVLTGHDNWIACISYSPDGVLIATASEDTTVRIWSSLSGDTIHILCDHTEPVTGVAFSPTGLHVASCSEDKTIRTWDAQTGEPLLRLEGHIHLVLSVAYSPDGHQIASTDAEDTMVLWDARTGIATSKQDYHAGLVFCVAYSGDGHQIASGGGDRVVITDPHNGDLIGTLSGHTASVIGVSYSRNCKYIASSSRDGTVRLWDVGRVLKEERLYDSVNGWQCAKISPDGTQIVTGHTDGTVQLWDTLTRKPEFAFKGHTHGVVQVEFSPCGRRVASASNDSSVRLWCARTGESVHVLRGHTECVLEIEFSARGQQIASASMDKTVRLWNTETGESGLILEGHGGAVHGVAYSPSGCQIASCSDDNTVRLWCASAGELLLSIYHETPVKRLMFTSDGQEIISISWQDGILHCWDIKYGRSSGRLALKEHSITCSTFSPCGKLIATNGRDGILRLWDRASGAWLEVFKSPIGTFVDIRWVQGLEGMYLVTSTYGSVRVWEMKEIQGSYKLMLLWSLGRGELSLTGANLTGSVGLSSIDLELVKQRGAIMEAQIESLQMSSNILEK